MSKKNKPVSVEISDPVDQRSEVKINKVTLGYVLELDDGVMIEYPDQHQVKVPDFDAGVAKLIAEYNLHH
ncbi:hypothetical protein JOC36_001263 [Weissella uvarum]|uniref:DUF2969 family protein n=1 Tax=Weissella uvarum TaxID=1479233 RepID=UPI001960C4B7|nr:DUF2969 family protein [Weissella uvarum]MBM7617701.1 hypothetical protein [Weissella uvarum]MCM0596050.1 DUF2969 family protein [Weissella uvarum]